MSDAAGVKEQGARYTDELEGDALAGPSALGDVRGLIVATATSSEPITTDYATVQEGWRPTAHCPIPAALLAQTSRLRARPSE